jgi:predicted nucleotidyltransferase
MITVKNIPLPLRKKGIRDKLLGICQANGIVFMAVFGSFVTGRQKRGSDLDIAIRFGSGQKKSLFDLVELEQKLKRLFGRKVDLGELDSINPYIIDYVKKQMKVVYEEG